MKDKKLRQMLQVKMTEPEWVPLDFIKARFGFRTDAQTVRFALEFTAKNAKLEMNNTRGGK